MESKWSIIALLGILMSIAALAAAQPAPFLIGGWVNYTDGNPVNDPSVTVTNQYTGEVFTAEANAGSNYYQIQTSSDNVSAGNVLHFVVSKGSNSTEFDHTVSATEVGDGGFEQNATVGPGSAVVCGDVTGDGAVNMGDVTKLLWNQTYWGQYPVDPCAADVTGGGGVNMGDVTKLLWNQTYWGQYPLTCPC
jgi:hypothetical protein